MTTGDPDGVSFRVEDTNARTQISFRSDVVSCDVPVETIRGGPVTVDAGGIDMKVVFEMEPTGVGNEARMNFRDAEVEAGLHPYWIRVVQTDGAKAWVSPFYVKIV